MKSEPKMQGLSEIEYSLLSYKTMTVNYSYENRVINQTTEQNKVISFKIIVHSF